MFGLIALGLGLVAPLHWGLIVIGAGLLSVMSVTLALKIRERVRPRHHRDGAAADR